MTDKIVKKLLKDKAASKPDTKTATACTTAITKLDTLEIVMEAVNPLKENTKIPPYKKIKYTPRNEITRLMLGLAEAFAKSRNGALIGTAEMLKLLSKNGATIKRSDKAYVTLTDTIAKKLIIVSKHAFETRLTRIRKHIKEKYPT